MMRRKGIDKPLVGNKPLAMALFGGKTALKRPVDQSGTTGWFWTDGKRLLPHEELLLEQRSVWP